MRFTRLIATSIILCLAITGPLMAQISSGGTPVSFTKAVRADIHAVTMPPVDVAALLAEDSIEQGKGIPYRFGFPFEVNYDLDNSGTWENLNDGGRLWRLRVECPGAYSINLVYDEFWLPEGAKFFIYNEDRSYVIGAFTERNNKEYEKFATALVKGDVSILEYYEPADVEEPGVISIQRIIHAYKNLFDRHVSKDAFGFGDSGPCNNNVHCPEAADWQDQVRSVAMITTSGGWRLCSGVLVNNVRQDLEPYFLTANHCLGGEQTWVFMFNYESPSCANIDGPTWMTTSGSTLLASYSYSDFGLLLLSEQPPDSYNVYFAGWAADDLPSDTSVGIHHPSGDIKKISWDNDPNTSTAYLGGPGSGNSHWRVGNWEDGTTEPGSSGSPLFNTEHRVVGQLHGGYASCTSITPDWYGKFSKSWNYGGSASTRLKDWLDPDNTGTLLLDGRDAAGISIEHEPLADTKDTLNDYEVVCTITSDTTLVADSLLLYYEIASTWYEDTLVSTGGEDEYHGFIAAQSPGTIIDYYLYAQDAEGTADTTDTYTFRVIDYGLTLEPSFDSAMGAVDDTVWYQLTVTNTGVYADDYSLTYSGNSWSTSLWDETQTTQINSTGTLLGDESFIFTVRVIVPLSMYGDYDSVEVEARSTGDPGVFAVSNLQTISAGQPLPIPFTDNFPTTTIDAGKWVLISGATSNDVGLNEPSAPYSANFNGSPNGADTIMSQALDLKDESNVIVKYFYQQTGGGESPDASDDLFVEYLDSTGGWSLLQQHLGADPDMTEFAQVELALPGDAYHSGFRLRLRNAASIGNFDDWFVDDVYVGLPPDYKVAITPPFVSQYGPAGDSAWYLLTIHNQGLYDDTYDLSDSGGVWDVGFFDESGVTPITSVGPVTAGDSMKITVKVAIPGDAIMNESDTARVYAVSQNDPGVASLAVLVTISAGGPGTFPWFEPFPDDTLDSVRWVMNVGGEVSTEGLAPPSSPYSFNLDGGIDTAVTQLIDLSGQSGVILSYYYQRGGGGESPDAGDDLWVEYKNNVGAWVTVNQHLGSEPVMNTFEHVSAGLSGEALHNGFQLRLRSYGTGAAYDDWFVDDIRLDYAPALTVSPPSFAPTLPPDDSTTDELIIANAGPGNLIYSIEVIPDDGLPVALTNPSQSLTLSKSSGALASGESDTCQWLTLSSSSGELASGAADTIVCTFISVGVDTGIYNSNIVITSNDPDSSDNPWTVPVELTVTSAPVFTCGDINGNGQGPNVADLTYLVDYLYFSGSPPPVMEAADVDGSGGNPNIADLTYLVDYLFHGGSDLNCP